MKLWRIQPIYSAEIHCPNVHRDEEAAKGEVAYLLGNWLSKNLSFDARMQERNNAAPEYVADAKGTVRAIAERLSTGDVWGALDVWDAFYDKYENFFDLPLYIRIGSVIVQSMDEKSGPVKRRKMLPQEKNPYARYKEKGGVPAMREDFEAGVIIEEILSKLAEKLGREGKTMTNEEFKREFEAVGNRLNADLKAKGVPFDPDTFLPLWREKLLEHFGLE